MTLAAHRFVLDAIFAPLLTINPTLHRFFAFFSLSRFVHPCL